MRIPFLALGLAEDREAVERAIGRVVDRAWFVLGPEVDAFEREFAEACGARHAVGVGTRETACPSAERLASTVLSLPLNPGLSDAAVDAVAGAVANALPAGASQPR